METSGELSRPIFRAVLWTYWCDGIFGHRRILVGTSAEQYARDLAVDLAEAIKVLVEHHSEYLNVAELDATMSVLLGRDVDPDEEWNWLDVDSGLKALPDIAADEARRTGNVDLKQATWYRDVIRNLNEEFPGSDGVWIDIEGPMNDFLTSFCMFQASDFTSLVSLPEASAIYLGRLSVLSQIRWSDSTYELDQEALAEVIRDFNEANSEISRLD